MSRNYVCFCVVRSKRTGKSYSFNILYTSWFSESVHWRRELKDKVKSYLEDVIFHCKIYLNKFDIFTVDFSVFGCSIKELIPHEYVS